MNLWRSLRDELRRHPYRTAAEFLGLLAVFLFVFGAWAVAEALFLYPP